MSLRHLALLVAVCSCGGPSKPASPKFADAAESGKSTDPPRDEEAVIAERRRTFMDGCLEELPGAKPYCDCGWQLLSSMLTRKELVEDEAPDRKLGVFKEQVGVACAEKMPESVVERMYMAGCTDQAPGHEAFCTCSYERLRDETSVSAIAAGGTEDRPRFEASQEKAVAACADEIDIGVLKSRFMDGCVKGPELESYCRCAWKVVHGSVSPATLVSGGPELEAATGRVETACKQHAPKQHAPKR